MKDENNGFTIYGKSTKIENSSLSNKEQLVGSISEAFNRILNGKILKPKGKLKNNRKNRKLITIRFKNDLRINERKVNPLIREGFFLVVYVMNKKNFEDGEIYYHYRYENNNNEYFFKRKVNNKAFHSQY